MLPFLVRAGGDRLHRDLSQSTLQSHARSRSLHALPLTPAALYDVCGEANEVARNRRSDPGRSGEFAVVWLGELPEGARARALAFRVEDAADAETLVCVSCDASACAAAVWLRGTVAATAPDAALAMMHAFLRAHELAESSFRTLDTAHTKSKEWAATRAAAVVATAARAWCHGADVLAAVDHLPRSDAFVVQYDHTVASAEAAMADVLSEEEDARDTPAPPPAHAGMAYNAIARVFF